MPEGANGRLLVLQGCGQVGMDRQARAVPTPAMSSRIAGSRLIAARPFKTRPCAGS